MSTPGSPGGRQIYSKPTPPERGSFPLDHDNECRHIMTSYLSCLRTHRGTNSNECRQLSKAYLQCRMDKNLMLPDEMRNLGFQETQSEIGGGDGGAQGSRVQEQMVGSVREAKEGKALRDQEELREMAGRSRGKDGE